MFFNNLSRGNVLKSISDDENSKFIIEGVMSKAIIDLEGEMISGDAYPHAANMVKEKLAAGSPIPIFIEHRRKELSLPVGKVIDAWNDADTLYFKAEIAGGILGTPIRELIKGGFLRGCSIGGDAIQTRSVYDNKAGREVKQITKMELRELSLTGLPVNEAAVFSIAKSLNKEEGEVKTLMKSLNSAIDSQKLIFDLEKAVDPENLDEASLMRIKDSLSNLAKLLKIDVAGTETGAQDANGTQDNTGTQGANGMQSTQAAQPKENVSSQVEQGKQFAPQQEDTTMNDKNQNEDQALDATSEPANTGDSKLDELHRKIDELHQKLDGNKIEKDETDPSAEEDDLDLSSDEGTDDSTENVDDEGTETDENEGEEGDAHEQSETPAEESKENKFEKKKFPKNLKREKSLLYFKGGENMDILKCRGCSQEFEGANYDAKFCPSCGDRVINKSMVTEETNDIVCEDCGSVFGKSYEFDTHYCPKCGKSLNADTVAVAPSPKGAKTTVTKDKYMPEGKVETDTVAVAPQPKGATTKVEASEEKDTGSSVADNEGANFIDANDKVRTDKTDEDINEARPSGKTLLGSFDAEKLSNYGKDRVGKSLDERLGKIEKALESIVSIEKSFGKQTLVPFTEEPAKIEKSVATQEDIDRAFVSFIMPK